MRRVVVLVLSLAVLGALGMSPANAAKHERYRSEIFNAYWNSHHKVDSTTFDRQTWYVGVYSSGDNFFSDLYRSVEQCSKLSGHIRCKQVSYWYASIRKLGSGTFSIDRKLDTGSLTATYDLVDKTNKVDLGTTNVSVSLTGYGNLSSYTDRETYTDGCRSFRYSDKSKSRSAYASGTYQIGSDPSQSFGFTSNAFMSRGSSVDFSKTC